MRILLVSDHYPPFIGGAHRQTQLLARRLHQRGFEVAVVAAWQPDLPDSQQDEGVTVYRVKQLRTIVPWLLRSKKQRYQPPFPDPVTVWQLRRLIARFQPHVVHSYGWFTYSVAAALLGNDIPLLITSRDYAYPCPTRELLYFDREICTGPAVLKCLICSSNHFGRPKGVVTTFSIHLGRALIKRKIRGTHEISTYVRSVMDRDLLGRTLTPLEPKTIRPLVRAVIPSFLEAENLSITHTGDPELLPYIRRLPRQPFILFVGALRLIKGVRHLLEAYERLDSPPPLVLIGTIEHDTPRTFPSGVVVLEDFPHRAVLSAWEYCLFGVMPSLSPEPLGSVIYEAMSKGKAVIGTTPGGHADMIIDGETGLLVPSGDVDRLTEAMEQLLRDPQRRERFGHAARITVHKFTDVEAIPRFEQLYSDLRNG